MPLAGGIFASRQAQRMAYQSQSAALLDRLRDKSWKLEKRLWPEKGRRQPRGRNRERLLAAWEHLENSDIPRLNDSLKRAKLEAITSSD